MRKASPYYCFSLALTWVELVIVASFRWWSIECGQGRKVDQTPQYCEEAISFFFHHLLLATVAMIWLIPLFTPIFIALVLIGNERVTWFGSLATALLFLVWGLLVGLGWLY